jgi:hypothetical protein
MNQPPNPGADAAAVDLRAQLDAKFPDRPAVVEHDDYGHKLKVRITDPESRRTLIIDDTNLLAVDGLSADQRAALVVRVIHNWIGAGCP